MLRTFAGFFAFAALCCGQAFPSFQWIMQVDGSGSDQLAGLGTDAQGNIYLAGTTQSPNFRVKNAAQKSLAGGSDVFVTKLDPAGNLVYSTYFGGSGNDTATAMAVDPLGGVYVTGTTASTDFPATLGAYLSSVPAPTISGAFASFVFKLNPDGSVAYASYFLIRNRCPTRLLWTAAGLLISRAFRTEAWSQRLARIELRALVCHLLHFFRSFQ